MYRPKKLYDGNKPRALSDRIELGSFKNSGSIETISAYSSAVTEPFSIKNVSYSLSGLDSKSCLCQCLECVNNLTLVYSREKHRK
jgi:hypothetical protein